MIRHLLFLSGIIMLLFLLGACHLDDKEPDSSTDLSNHTSEGLETSESTDEVNEDTIPPYFIKQGEALFHVKGQTVDLLQGFEAIDNITKPDKLIVRVAEDNGYNPNLPGRYTIVIEAIDEAGNRTTVEREVVVMDTRTVEIQAIVAGELYAEYVYNDPEALKYTASGAIFRRYDVVQVMDKNFFLMEYEEHAQDYTDNGGVPYLYNGVVVLLDSDFHVKHVRLSSPEVEIDEEGTLKLTHLNWTNSRNAQTGGGNFMNIKEAIATYIPEGGYVVFAPYYDEGKAKKFLVRSLFDSEYEAGQLTLDRYNVSIPDVKFQLMDNYQISIPVEPDENMTIDNGVVKIKKYLEGIPITIYYKNDGKTDPRPLIFFFHGFGGDRESGIMDRGIELAKRGFYVVAMDAYLHGERAPEYFNNLSYAEKQKEIVNIQVRTAEEAKYLFEKYFKPSGQVLPDKVYAYGVSMGAGSAFYLATIMDELKTVVSIVGSPSFVAFYQYKAKMYNFPRDDTYYTNLNSYYDLDPLINYERLRGKAIFMGNGSQDTVVPAEYAQQLSEKLKDENVIYKLYQTGHSSTNQMLQDAYDFLNNN